MSTWRIPMWIVAEWVSTGLGRRRSRAQNVFALSRGDCATLLHRSNRRDWKLETEIRATYARETAPLPSPTFFEAKKRGSCDVYAEGASVQFVTASGFARVGLCHTLELLETSLEFPHSRSGIGETRSQSAVGKRAAETAQSRSSALEIVPSQPSLTPTLSLSASKCKDRASVFISIRLGGPRDGRDDLLREREREREDGRGRGSRFRRRSRSCRRSRPSPRRRTG